MASTAAADAVHWSGMAVTSCVTKHVNKTVKDIKVRARLGLEQRRAGRPPPTTDHRAVLLPLPAERR